MLSVFSRRTRPATAPPPWQRSEILRGISRSASRGGLVLGYRRPVDEGESTDVRISIVSFEDDHVLIATPLRDEILEFGAEAIALHGRRFHGRGGLCQSK